MKKLSEIEITEELKVKASQCATAEEVEKLAQEYDVELTAEEISDILKNNNLRELKDEQLDYVAGGGDWAVEKSRHLPANHGAYIGKYSSENYIRREVYCVTDTDPEKYCWGTLVESSERSVLHEFWGEGTRRLYVLDIHGTSTDPLFLDYWDVHVRYAQLTCVHAGEKVYDIMGDHVTLFEYL